MEWADWCGSGLLDEDDTNLPDGFIRENDPEKVRQEPYPMLDSFEWVTMDLTNDAQVRRLHSTSTRYKVLRVGE